MQQKLICVYVYTYTPALECQRRPEKKDQATHDRYEGPVVASPLYVDATVLPDLRRKSRLLNLFFGRDFQEAYIQEICLHDCG
jgi:hypothetical protein